MMIIITVLSQPTNAECHNHTSPNLKAAVVYISLVYISIVYKHHLGY